MKAGTSSNPSSRLPSPIRPKSPIPPASKNEDPNRNLFASPKALEIESIEVAVDKEQLHFRQSLSIAKNTESGVTPKLKRYTTDTEFPKVPRIRSRFEDDSDNQALIRSEERAIVIDEPNIELNILSSDVSSPDQAYKSDEEFTSIVVYKLNSNADHLIDEKDADQRPDFEAKKPMEIVNKDQGKVIVEFAGENKDIITDTAFPKVPRIRSRFEDDNVPSPADQIGAKGLEMVIVESEKDKLIPLTVPLENALVGIYEGSSRSSGNNVRSGGVSLNVTEIVQSPIITSINDEKDCKENDNLLNRSSSSLRRSSDSSANYNTTDVNKSLDPKNDVKPLTYIQRRRNDWRAHRCVFVVEESLKFIVSGLIGGLVGYALLKYFLPNQDHEEMLYWKGQSEYWQSGVSRGNAFIGDLSVTISDCEVNPGNCSIALMPTDLQEFYVNGDELNQNSKLLSNQVRSYNPVADPSGTNIDCKFYPESCFMESTPTDVQKLYGDQNSKYSKNFKKLIESIIDKTPKLV